MEVLAAVVRVQAVGGLLGLPRRLVVLLARLLNSLQAVLAAAAMLVLPLRLILMSYDAFYNRREAQANE